MIAIAYNHALRASELVGIEAHHIESGFLTVQRLKGSLKTTQPLIEHEEPLLNEKPALIEFIRGMHANQRIFPVNRSTFFRTVQRYAKAADLPKHLRHPHVLKHSLAMHVIEKAGIHNVRQYLGHKSISSTGEYLKVSDSDASSAVLRAARGDGIL